MEVIILTKLPSEMPITLKKVCVTLSMREADFSPKKWLTSSLGKETKS